ncbi:zinc finger CCHC domain-containing protein 8 homolog [Eurytemora carolleeae]|uniref:zinc finger CCHC domain-containing protein 8 homolog n=1 Tax=Eurytemora carolleeae TaxID=1294199 RepID=UPI000C76F97F|nr:zinc finger CCHC domain-containing protein 8 homolog [Eurytemora carolleeae]|eukprot:XP_023336104.1 zinc finger CCHC domain-containing protein 8 homolog [Eurytemora affinis]
MAAFLSVIESIGKDANELTENEDHSEDKSLQIDEKELEEQVNDLVEIRKKDVLKKNLMNIVRENLELKQKIKILESKLENQTSNDDSYNLLFRIDVDGDEEVPSPQSTNLQTGLILTDSQEEVVDEEPKKGGNKCFNCLGDHMMFDCPNPRDQKEINKNKKEFAMKTAMFNKNRYHVDEPQKFGHLQPGLPSSKLREALRLRDDQVPEYIYRMRALGYPPGWLLHAEINSSGIQLYHERGQKVEDPCNEDGEVVDEKDKVEFDIEKLIDWPGFNSELPREYRDESSKYRAVPFNRVRKLKDMIDELKPREQKAYVRSKMQDTSVNDKVETIDLDGTIVLDSTVESDTEMEEVTQDINKEVKKDGKDTSGLNTPSISTPTRQHSSSSTGINVVSKTEPGTPICEIFSPFSRLPSQSGFAKDMSEHVAFENLPDSTGKWDQMVGLIKRIRKRRVVEDEDTPPGTQS